MSQKLATEAEWRRGMADIFAELNQLYDADEMGAVQINIVRRNGDIRTLRAFDQGFKLLMIAAAAIGQRESIEEARDAHDPDCPLREGR